MTKAKWWGVGASVVLALALAVGCGNDSNGGGPTGPTIDRVPESWRGVWKLVLDGSVCDVPVPVPVPGLPDTLIESLCPGDSLEFGLPISLPGTGCENGSLTATETSLSFSCSGPYSEGTCTGTISANFNITINPTNDTINGSGRVNIQLSGSLGCSNYCIDLTMTGNRISTTPDCPVNAPKESFLTQALERIRNQR